MQIDEIILYYGSISFNYDYPIEILQYQSSERAELADISSQILLLFIEDTFQEHTTQPEPWSNGIKYLEVEDKREEKKIHTHQSVTSGTV